MADPTVITVQTMKGPFEAISANGADFIWAAGTVTDGDTFVCTGREILLAHNVNVAAKTITIVSVNDETNRAEDITTYSIGAGEYAAFGQGLTNSKGWKSSSGTIRVTVEHADVMLAVLRLPAGFPN